MFWSRLPLRALLPNRSSGARRIRAALTCAWLAAVGGLVAINAANIRPADRGRSSQQQSAFLENQPPHIMVYAGYQGDGIWLVWGHVYDEEAYAMTVRLTSSAFPTEDVEVNAQGNFYYSVYCSGGASVFADATDPEGLAAPQSSCRLGF